MYNLIEIDDQTITISSRASIFLEIDQLYDTNILSRDLSDINITLTQLHVQIKQKNEIDINIYQKQYAQIDINIYAQDRYLYIDIFAWTVD